VGRITRYTMCSSARGKVDADVQVIIPRRVGK
jgi:hypothetical protein